MTIDCSIGRRGQLQVDSSVEAARLVNITNVVNALFGLSQSAACTRNLMNGLL